MGFILLALLIALTVQEDCKPYGVRLFLGHYFSYLRNSNDMIRVVFNTQGECSDSFILKITDNTDKIEYFLSEIKYYETKLLNMTQIYEKNETTHFDYHTFIHTFQIGIRDVNLSNNEFNYSIMSSDNKLLLGPYIFNIPLQKGEQKLLVFGDMDSNWKLNYSKDTFDWLENQVKENKKYDTIIYTGDMAYDLESNNCQQGDNWLRNISVFTNRYPFMAAPGNHDWGNNTYFDFFRANFGTLYLKEYDTANYLNDFVSFDIGLVHFIQFNPIKAVYKNDKYNITPYIVEQMRNDLNIANKNREDVPWIVVYAHYPIYCSEKLSDMCSNNYKYLSAIEDLFVEFRVDLYISGHQHNYQRNKPYYQNKPATYIKDGNTYKNYTYPVSIIEGAAGTDYGAQNNSYPENDFMEIQNPDHGVGILTVVNKTHLYFEHITVADNKMIDSIWIDRSIQKPAKVKHDGFEVTMWIMFALLLVMTGVSVYYKQAQARKQHAKLLGANENLAMVIS